MPTSYDISSMGMALRLIVWTEKEARVMADLETSINECPMCDCPNIEHVDTREDVVVKGEAFNVRVVYYKCHGCGEEFEPLKPEHDSIEEAFNLYLAKYGVWPGAFDQKIKGTGVKEDG